MPTLDIKDVRLLESVEKEHAALGFNDIVAKVLGVEKEPMRMDSQAKYGALARGDGGVYLRMPTGVGYREKIWVRALLFYHSPCMALCCCRHVETLQERYLLWNVS